MAMPRDWYWPEARVTGAPPTSATFITVLPSLVQ